MYYPLSQIQTNLYTNGNEFVYDNLSQDVYIGYYWKTSKNEYFTGKTPQDLPNSKLIPFIDPVTAPNEFPRTDTVQYFDPLTNSLINYPTDFYPGDYPLYKESEIIFGRSAVPSYSPTYPTQQDYQLGEMRRYFCKKTNEIIYLEINKDTYNKLSSKNSTITFQYYTPFNIPWKLTGTKEQIYKVNKNIVELTMKQKKLPMFDLYLKKNYTKYTA